MKSRHRQAAAALIVIVFALIAAIGGSYFKYISERIREHGIGHLNEVYGQLSRNLGSFLEQTQSSLGDWDICLRSLDGEETAAFLEERKSHLKFSQFYFILADGTCISPDGTSEIPLHSSSKKTLLTDREPMMSAKTLPGGQAVTLLAIPVQSGKYKDYTYSAIAVSYTNADILNTLSLDAFSGEASYFVADTDGDVLISTAEDTVSGNCLDYLRTSSSLSENDLSKLKNDWRDGKSGTITCQIGGSDNYLCYRNAGQQGLILLGAVPISAANADLAPIQRAAADVLVKVFLLICALIILWLAYRRRLTARRGAAELRRHEMMLDALSSNVSDIFLMLDAGTFRADYLSPNVERLLGIPHKTALENVKLLDGTASEGRGFITPDGLRAIPVYESRCIEREHIHQVTGEARWYKESAYHENIDGAEKFLIVMSDRTSDRETNTRLKQSLEAANGANKAKNNFIVNMSRNIRTPMNAIMGFSALMEKNADDAEKVREYTDKISSSGRHLLALINDVLDLNKIESGKTPLSMGEFSLSELIEELNTILLPQAKAKNQTFEIHTDIRVPERLLGDKLHLDQILMSLLSNAIEYTPAGGRIDLTIQSVPSPSAQYALLRFIVKDNGCGMSEELLKVIFDPFAEEKNNTGSASQGSGLSMAITKNLIGLMGGTIDAESEPRKGSVFTAELPFALPPSGSDKKASQKHIITHENAADVKAFDGMRFLVAEDNEINAEILTELFKEENGTCDIVQNGRLALEKFKASKTDFYDMILMDVQMPVMDGYEATKAIRECGHPRAKTVPIVAMTAKAFTEDVKCALDAGMNTHLSKPVDMDTIKKVIGEILKKR